MSKIFTEDLNSISAPEAKVEFFETVKAFFEFLQASISIQYVAFDDSEYDIVVGFGFNTDYPDDPTLESCFWDGEKLSVYLREAI